jgi:hypothetical protein
LVIICTPSNPPEKPNVITFLLLTGETLAGVVQISLELSNLDYCGELDEAAHEKTHKDTDNLSR